MKSKFLLFLRVNSLILFCVTLIFVAAQQAGAQQVRITTPKHQVGDSFVESIGTSWSLSGKNWFFKYGGSGAAVNPMFGNYDPGMGMQTGFSFNRGGVQGDFNFWAGHGTERFYSGETPSMTLINGQQGYVGDVSNSPFVISVTPVVGDGGYSEPGIGTFGTPSRGNMIVQEALARVRAAQEADAAGDFTSADYHRAAVGSAPKTAQKSAVEKKSETASLPGHLIPSTHPLSAETPTLSVADMRKMRKAEKEQEYSKARELAKKGENAEEAGNLRSAKSYYREAIPLASPELKEELLERLGKMER